MNLIQKYQRQYKPHEPPLARKLPTAVVVTKADAAFNQIMLAIEMLLRGRYECALTLAGAAEELFEPPPQSAFRWLREAPVPDELRDHAYAAFTKKQRDTFWNTLRNWLKHTDSSHPNRMRISRKDAGGMIVRAISHLPERPLAPEHDALFRTFFALWFHDVGWKPPAA